MKNVLVLKSGQDKYSLLNPQFVYATSLYIILQSDDEDSGNDSDVTDGGKRKRFDEETLERRMEKRKWEENR